MRSRMEQRASSAPNPAAATAPRSYRRMHGNGSSDQAETLPYRRSHSYDKQESPHPRTNSHAEEEGVEVVLDVSRNSPKVVDSDGRDQNVFRGPQSQRRPNPTRSPVPVPSSTSYGGYGAPPRGNYPPRPPPMQVPYNKSGSFDHGEYPPPPQHYSPHVHYPTPGARGYPGEDVNVISPNHKPDPYNPPVTPRSRGGHPPGYYQYPPTSPVSRPGATGNSPPRRHYGGMRRGEGPYSVAQRQGGPPTHHPEDGTFNRYPPTSGSRDGRPPLVTESSFDSDHYESAHSPYSSHPPTPAGAHPGYEAHHPQGFYGEGSWGSFDSANGGAGAPPHFDDYRYYGYPPESPYSQYSPTGAPYYGGEHLSPYNHPYDRNGYENEEDRMLNEYHHEDPSLVTPHHDPRQRRDNESPSTQETQVISNKTCANGSLLPKAAAEIDFEVTAPPAKPVCPPSDGPIYESHNNINSHDVLCGRGGGTNSQVGNRRFRKLVQEFQPTYLMARRKEKPLLARTIVLIIRKRGGHFLKKDEETGELYEVGDLKAEAKTSQALREGLDVRATKSAATGDKKGKKKKDGTSEISLADEDDAIKEEDEEDDDDDENPTSLVAPAKVESNSPIMSRARTPPPRPEDAGIRTPPASPTLTLPKLAGEDGKSTGGIVHPHSPEIFAFRKRRRMRSREGCFPLEDKLFPDFCPPRADLGRTTSPIPDYMEPGGVSMRRMAFEQVPPEDIPQPGCAGIAMSIMTGAATGSFCLGPSNWSRK